MTITESTRKFFEEEYGPCIEMRFVNTGAMTPKLKKKLERASHQLWESKSLPERVPWPKGTTFDPNDRCPITGELHPRLPDGIPLRMVSACATTDLEHGTMESVGVGSWWTFIDYNGALKAYPGLYTDYCPCYGSKFLGFIYGTTTKGSTIFFRKGWEEYVVTLKERFAMPLAPVAVEKFITSLHEDSPCAVVQWGIPAEGKRARKEFR